MQYRVLGPVEVRLDGTRVNLGAYKQRALLALLLIHVNEVVSTDRIIDEIWGEDPGRDRQNALWTVVSRLRAVLEPERERRSDGTILLSRPPGYLLAVETTDLDAARFEALAHEGRALAHTDPAAAALVLSEALALWHGRAYEEFTFEPFAEAEIARLEELRLTTVEDRIRADLATGRSRELIGELESLVKQHPLRERLTGHLMLALHRSGRQSDALRAFGALQRRLGEELGLEPSAELVQLEERIVLDDPSLRHATAARALTGQAEPGLSVRGYELRERIGQGAMGHVYRAFQPAVGREVAIKVIRPELANDPDFIRRFEHEARAVAGLEHPWIVPVFDYWREPDSAFLVMRRFDRGSLRGALDDGPLSTDAAARILEQVASALTAAHRRGVVHGDVKPANVLLDDDGNAYLADFGMSFGEGDPEDEQFAAPEVRTGGTATPSSDMYSLGAIAAHVLRGAVGGDRHPDSPLVGPAADVIARACATDPGERFPEVREFIAALDAALGAPPEEAAPSDVDVPNPYRGLRAFDESDADRFFGRERLVERLLARLGHTGPNGRFVAVVGPSGSGKSSVVRAGAVPALRGGALPGSDRWFLAAMIPGRRPFEALEDALLTVAVDPPPNLLDRLVDDGIASTAGSLIVDPGAQLVIVVDQLEELFAAAAPDEAAAFMSALADAAGDRHSRVKVIVTLRADFYDQPLRHREFGELLRLGTEVITPMNADELERAITAPAEGVGVSFEPGLVATILDDMSGQSTALPLLQYALTELFEQRRGTTITAEEYRQLGGVSVALARRADGLYEGFDQEQRTHPRDVFLRLVALGEGAADTRRRVLLSEIRDIGGDETAGVLDRFGRHRLLTFDRDPVTRGPTVEIAHEALLTEWGRLRQWIDDTRLDVRAQRRLAAAEADWRERGHDAGYLLTGARLARYDGWVEHPPVRLTRSEREFLAASRDAAEAEVDAERRRARRLRRLVASTAIALVVALVAGGVALRSRQSAVEAAHDAELATLISRSAALRTEDPDLSLLLALEAHRRAPGAETEQAVMNALGGATIVNRIARRQALVDDCYGSSLFRADGSVEFATVDGKMLTRDPLTGKVTDLGPPPVPCAIGVSTGEIGAATLPDGSRMWFGPEWQVELEFDEPTFPFVSGSDTRAVTASFGDPPVVQLRDIATAEPVGEPLVGPGFVAAAASPDQSVIAVSLGFGGTRAGTDGTIVFLDAATGAESSRVGLAQAATGMAWDASTGELIAGLMGGGIATIDPATGEVLAEVETGATNYLDVAVGPDGLVIAIAPGQIVYVDRRTGRVGDPVELRGVEEAWVRRDGLVVTRSADGEIDVLDLGAGGLIEQAWGVDRASQVRMHDGRAAALDFLAQIVTVTDLSTGEQSTTDLASAPTGAATVFAALPEDDGFWVITGAHTADRWRDERVVGRVPLGSEGVRPLDPRLAVRVGDHLATVGVRPDGTHEVTLVRLGGDDAGVVLTVEVPGPSFAYPTTDGGLLVADEGGTLRSYDRDGKLVQELSTGLAESTPVNLDPGGRRLVMRSLVDNGLHIVDLATGTVDAVAPGVANHALTGDGRLLAVVLSDGTIRLWDVERRAWAGLVWDGTGELGRSGPGWYDPASDSLWIASSGQLLQIPVDPTRWIERACEIVGRDFTDQEWDRLVPGSEPVRSACA